MTPARFRITSRWLIVAALLGVLLVMTWAVRVWRLDQVRQQTPRQQTEAAEKALVLIQRDFTELQEDLLALARTVAEPPEVARALRIYTRKENDLPSEVLVARFEALDLPEHVSVELYDPTPRLVAWQGTGMPLDEAPSRAGFLDRVQMDITREEENRAALALWVPIREGTQVVGVLRVLRLLHFEPPVENQYLSEYRYAQQWQRRTGLPVVATFGDDLAPPPGGDPSTLLHGLDGTVLGRVVVEEPSSARLVEAERTRYNDVLAFWASLLLGWGLAALWTWYRHGARARSGGNVHRRLRRRALRFLVVGAAWWACRYALLVMDVPGRWQQGRAPLSPLFDPAHLASSVGEGIMRSTGDMLVTALFALFFALASLDLAGRFRQRGSELYRLWRGRMQDEGAERPSVLRYVLTAFLVGVVALLLTLGLGLIAQQAILDSTLDYFARRGLIPERVVLTVFAALLLLALAMVMLLVALVWIALWFLARYRPRGWSETALVVVALVGVMLPAVAGYPLAGLATLAPPLVALLIYAVVGVLAAAGFVQRRDAFRLLALRNVLLGVFVLTVLLYPMLYQGMDAQRRIRIAYAAESFDNGRDPRVIFAIEQVLEQARQQRVGEVLRGPLTDREQQRLDSLTTELLRGSLLASLNLYEVSLTVFDAAGRSVVRSTQNAPLLVRSRLDEIEALEFDVLRQMYREGGYEGVFVDQLTGRRERERFQYAGVVPISLPGSAGPAWVMVRAEPQTLLRDSGTPFPRVLLPAGLYGSLYTNLSLAEFRDGVMVRSFGRNFGRYRLDLEAQRALLAHDELWRREVVRDQAYLTYYRRDAAAGPAGVLPQGVMPSRTAVVAARVPAVTTFDHLYYLLRLTVAGLFIGIPVYLLGLYLRWRAGRFPAPRIRFRDKVLNAFLAVGLVTVAAVGLVGMGLVTTENERAIQNWLRQNLERVEETLVLEGRADEMPYRVLDRIRIDTLAARVGLDLNVYRGKFLVASSRPQLVREDLIDERLPIEAYHALYYEGYRFTYTREQVGSFSYTTGFRTLLDERGEPRYVVAMPTLPEQERIEEERARTVAYLFGALLVLVLVVMLTASLIASALARPIARLREGLEKVARGRFESAIPVTTRDEIGELVQTFNTTQEQLAESRRKLAQQERQLAWREMARQVAHEIKNPLTPMKLSVQHLQRAHRRDGGDPEEADRFGSLFDRITNTLVEQIDALARIANEFHSFARMPTRMLETLDLNAVVEEAVALMQEEGEALIDADLYDEPLVVEADREELRRVYINLLKNAIQAIPEDQEGDIHVATELEQHAGRAWARSHVRDNGTGVPEELRGKIFEPNFSTKTSGTGLGLAITAKAVADLGGEIDFETQEGAGTTFWIRLPVKD